MTFPEIPNCELYLVGGTVRDLLLGRDNKDEDYVVLTKLSFQELVDTINNMPNSEVFLAKEEFATIRAKVNGKIIDVTYPRTDGVYSDGRRPDSVEITDDLELDASRRDFTINALYQDKNGEIIDFFDGKKDIERKAIRCINNPDDRFSEDYLRILRAIRLACQLKFGIHKDTLASMIKNAPKIFETVSEERIREELNKAFKASPFFSIELLEHLSIIEDIQAMGLTFQVTSKKKV